MGGRKGRGDGIRRGAEEAGDRVEKEGWGGEGMGGRDRGEGERVEVGGQGVGVVEW